MAGMAEGLELDYGQEEAAAKFGADPRVYLTTATKFEGDANGQLKAVHTVQVQWERNDKGQFIPKHVPGTEKVLPANSSCWRWVSSGRTAVAGFARHRARSADEREGGVREVSHEHQGRVRPPAIAGAARAWSCWAFNEGRGAARECDRYLMGHTDLP